MYNKQENRFSPIDETLVTQTVSVEHDEDANCEWIIVSHSGNELSMSYENWTKLCDLVTSTRIEHRIK